MKVVLIKGSDKRALVREAILSLGQAEFKQKILDSSSVLVHPNLVNYFVPKACSDVELVRGVLDHIALISDKKILVGDGGVHDTKQAFDRLNYPSLNRSANIKLVDLNDDDTLKVDTYTKDMGKKQIGFSKTVVESFNILAVPAKMHLYYTVSVSLKTHVVGSLVVPASPFGGYWRWPYLHTGYRQAHQSLAEIYQKYPAQMAVIDGTAAMEGNGPADGKIVNLKWLIASYNPVSADALAAYLVGYEPADIGYLYMLNQKGLGPIEIDEMEIVGEDPKALREKLKKPDSYPEILEWR